MKTADKPVFEQAVAAEAATPRDPGCKPAVGHKTAVGTGTGVAAGHPKDRLPPVLRLVAVVASDTVVGCLGIVAAAAASSLDTAAVASAAYHTLGPVALDSWMQGFHMLKRQGQPDWEKQRRFHLQKDQRDCPT